MKIVFDVKEKGTNLEVGTVTIEGNWGEPAFRKQCYLVLEFYEGLSLTYADIQSLSESAKTEVEE